jgi:hypothetical protein
MQGGDSCVLHLLPWMFFVVVFLIVYHVKSAFNV